MFFPCSFKVPFWYLEIPLWISIRNLEEAAREFELDSDETSLYQKLKYIFKTVNDNWEALAIKYGASRSDINKMRPAFHFSKEQYNEIEKRMPHKMKDKSQ